MIGPRTWKRGQPYGFALASSRFLKIALSASSSISKIISVFSIYKYLTLEPLDYVLRSNTDIFCHSAEHGKMQKQLLQAFFVSSRPLLMPKSCGVCSSLLHYSTIHHSGCLDRLTLWNSANGPLHRECLKPVNGLCQRRQIRRKSTIESAIGQEREKQTRAPWHREGSDIPPVARQRSAGAMTKGSRIVMCASAFTDVRLRKAIDDPVSPSEAHHTSHHS